MRLVGRSRGAWDVRGGGGGDDSRYLSVTCLPRLVLHTERERDEASENEENAAADDDGDLVVQWVSAPPSTSPTFSSPTRNSGATSVCSSWAPALASPRLYSIKKRQHSANNSNNNTNSELFKKLDWAKYDDFKSSFDTDDEDVLIAADCVYDNELTASRPWSHMRPTHNILYRFCSNSLVCFVVYTDHIFLFF